SRFLFAWFCVCVFPRPPRSSLFPYTTLFRSQVQHRLVDVESAAAVAGIDEVAHMRTGAAGQVQVPLAAVAKQLLQPLRAVALRLVVDIGAHEVVVTGQVGIEGIAGHGELLAKKGRASYRPT